MRKRELFTLLAIFLITSMACQAVTNLSGKNESEITDESVPIPVEVPTIQPTPTEKAEMPALPSEGWIAVHQDSNVWVVHPDGSDLKKVTSFPSSWDAVIRDIKWSPDGQTLAFTYDRDLYLMDAETFTQKLLVKNTGGSFDWSPDGNRIAYGTRQVDPYIPWKNKGIWVVNVESGKKEPLVKTTNDIEGMGRPQWSSDGKYILFQVSCIEICPFGVADLHSDTVLVLPLLHMAGGGGHLCEWAPDRSEIGCIQETPDALAIFDPRGRILNEYPLSFNIFAALWMADGQSLALGSYEDGQEQTHILRLEDETSVFLSDGSPMIGSPDGNWLIASMELDSQSEEELRIVDSETGLFQPITETLWGIVDWQPSPSEVPAVSGVEEANTPTVEQNVEESASTGSTECSALTITVLDTPKGDYYQVCALGIDYYDLGPLEKGSYAIGPNEKFFVYISNSGLVYAHRVGTSTMKQIGDVSSLSIIGLNKIPDFDYEFYGDHPYTIQVYENVFEQFSDAIPIPRYITTSK
ncbi:MAG: hypothetical protein HN916_17170 [Anaerolineae bacterium]|jgi:WD40 repeat protein|nr:hypothetical protein [Anaerolineae bacterium]